MERLPQKFEIWKYNADEDMKVIEFCTQEVIEEIDKVSDSIKEWFKRSPVFGHFCPRVFSDTKRPFSFIIWVINVEKTVQFSKPGPTHSGQSLSFEKIFR